MWQIEWVYRIFFKERMVGLEKYIVLTLCLIATQFYLWWCKKPFSSIDIVYIVSKLYSLAQ